MSHYDSETSLGQILASAQSDVQDIDEIGDIDSNSIDLDYDDTDPDADDNDDNDDNDDTDAIAEGKVEPLSEPEPAAKSAKEKLPVKKSAPAPGLAEGRETQYLLPSELTLDSRFDVRPYAKLNGDSATEQLLIEELAASLDKQGQFNPVLATRDPDKSARAKPIVVSGHRRFKAANLLNESLSAKGKSLFRLRVEFVPFDKSLKIALLDNLQRKQMSVLDVAMVCERLKSDNPDKKFTTRKLGDYLGVSQTDIVHGMQILTKADEATRNAVHEGRISAQSALDLLKIPDEKARKTALSVAANIQEDVDHQKARLTPAKLGKRAVDGHSTADKPEGKQGSVEGSAGKSANKRIEAPAIAKAIREVAPEAAPKRTRKEILEFFADQDVILHGFSNGAVRQFVKFLAKWADNTGSDKTLQAKFDAMVEYAFQGTKSKADDIDGEE